MTKTIRIKNKMENNKTMEKENKDQPKPIWTEDEVSELNSRQKDGRFHPYTCPGDKVSCKDQRDLIATPNGWVCQCGKYTQGWAHGVGGREMNHE
jgi:hypothetical protein